MNTQSTSVILILAHYGLQCEIDARGKRLLDILNDKSSAFLSVENVRYFQRNNSQPVVELDKTLISKSHVHMAVLVGEATKDSDRLFFAMLDRKSFHVVLSLPTSIVEGSLQTKVAPDPQAFLTIEASSFVPITKAVIHQLTSVADRLESPVVLVNKSQIGSLAFDPEVRS